MKNSNKVEFVINKVLLRNKAALIMILMACVIGLIQPIFFTTDNLFNVLRQVCASTILAMGFTFVLGLGEIDLSVGAILGLNGVIMAKLMMEANWPGVKTDIIPNGHLPGDHLPLRSTHQYWLCILRNQQYSPFEQWPIIAHIAQVFPAVLVSIDQ